MPETIHLETAGHMACLASTPVAKVKEIIRDIGAKPMFVINGLEHYQAEVAGTVIARANGWTNLSAYHRDFRNLEIHGNAD